MSVAAPKDLSTIKDFNLRVDALKAILASKDVYMPWSYTQHFDDVKDQNNPIEAAALIAQAYKDAYGLAVLEAELSHWRGEGKMLTIMDNFAHYESNNSDPIRNWLLEYAFKQAGFKRGAECDQEELRAIYNAAGYSGFDN